MFDKTFLEDYLNFYNSDPQPTEEELTEAAEYLGFEDPHDLAKQIKQIIEK